ANRFVTSREPGHLSPLWVSLAAPPGRATCGSAVPAEVWVQSGRAHEVVRGHLETEPLIEPASLDAAKCTHYLDRLSVVPRRSLERDVDQPFANSLRPVGFVDDQRGDRDEVPGPLELSSRCDGNSTTDIVMERGDHDVRRRRCRELSDDVLRWDDPSELIEQLADAGRVLRHRWAQRHVHAESVRGTDCRLPGRASTSPIAGSGSRNGPLSFTTRRAICGGSERKSFCSIATEPQVT